MTDDYRGRVETPPRTARADPQRFPRRVEVTSQDVLMKLTEVEHLGREAEFAQGRLRAAVGKHLAAIEELNLRLREVYPAIDQPDSGGAYYVRWEDRVYFVSWDERPPDDGGPDDQE